eukprot:1242419-Rhodomonas_salina.6
MMSTQVKHNGYVVACYFDTGTGPDQDPGPSHSSALKHNLQMCDAVMLSDADVGSVWGEQGMWMQTLASEKSRRPPPLSRFSPRDSPIPLFVIAVRCPERFKSSLSLS